MIDFSTLTGLTTPRGVVTQITDASGRVLWMLNTGGPVILEVKKITSNTYAGETTYNNEEFILLDIYPKKAGSTVDVTYGGLTKTLTFTGTNAKQVFFGTFNGISDSVETPASGELIIEGDYSAFGCGSFDVSSKINDYCGFIVGITDWGTVERIPTNAFTDCVDLLSVTIPDKVKSISGVGTFHSCAKLNSVTLPNRIETIVQSMFYDCAQLSNFIIPDSVTFIGADAFFNCRSLNDVTIPANVASVGGSAFYGCTNLALTALPDGITSIGSRAFYYCENITVNKMPSGMTAIPEYCFHGCTKVDAGTFDYTGITDIGKSAFEKSAFTVRELRLPEGVVSIGERAFAYTFRGGYEESYLYIPSTVTSIGAKAFMNGNQAPEYPANIYCYATVPPTVTPDSDGEYKMFHDYYKMVKITVPKGCGEAYKAAAGWSEYADNIVEAS